MSENVPLLSLPVPPGQLPCILTSLLDLRQIIRVCFVAHPSEAPLPGFIPSFPLPVDLSPQLDFFCGYERPTCLGGGPVRTFRSPWPFFSQTGPHRLRAFATTVSCLEGKLSFDATLQCFRAFSLLFSIPWTLASAPSSPQLPQVPVPQIRFSAGGALNYSASFLILSLGLRCSVLFWQAVLLQHPIGDSLSQKVFLRSCHLSS